MLSSRNWSLWSECCGSPLAVTGLLSRHIQFEVWVRSTVKFWQDIWCGDTPLRMCYPELFTISRNKEAYVADLMKFPNGVLFWDLNFVRAIQD